MGKFGKISVITGLVTLLHAAYSAAQHRTYLRATEQEFTSLPTDVYLQCLLGLILTCYGVVQVAGDFKEIRATAELDKKSWETLGNRPSFYTFSHRGRVLHKQMPRER